MVREEGERKAVPQRAQYRGSNTARAGASETERRLHWRKSSEEKVHRGDLTAPPSPRYDACHVTARRPGLYFYSVRRLTPPCVLPILHACQCSRVCFALASLS